MWDQCGITKIIMRHEMIMVTTSLDFIYIERVLAVKNIRLKMRKHKTEKCIQKIIKDLWHKKPKRTAMSFQHYRKKTIKVKP